MMTVGLDGRSATSSASTRRRACARARRRRARGGRLPDRSAGRWPPGRRRGRRSPAGSLVRPPQGPRRHDPAGQRQPVAEPGLDASIPVRARGIAVRHERRRPAPQRRCAAGRAGADRRIHRQHRSQLGARMRVLRQPAARAPLGPPARSRAPAARARSAPATGPAPACA